MYWLDCYYPTFIAFVVLNGFALVFAAASICAVAFGPLLLIWRGSPSWRQQVVKVGLFHLALSLISLLAAFAAAGFIVAGVWAPDPNCAKVLCSEGGVSCSAFAYHTISLSVTNRTSGQQHVTPYLQRILSPMVTKLNNASFTVGTDADITCQDYSYIANYSRIAELHPDQIVGGIQDASRGGTNDSCFIMLSESVFGIPTSNNTYLDPSLGNASKPNLYGMWCTRDGFPTGLGWLPLKLQRAADLVEAVRDELAAKPITGSQGYTFNRTASCPDSHMFNRADAKLKSSVPAFSLLKGIANPSRDDYMDPTYPTFSDNTKSDSEVNTTLQSAVCPYAVLMGWDARGAISCPDTSLGIRRIGLPGDRTWPLGAAVYYPSLKYQCSGLVDGSLCAYGTDPQSSLAYAVDEDGNYLQRRQASDKGSIYVHLGINPSNTRIYAAVTSMIVIAVAAILGTLALLGCLPYTGPCLTLRRLSGLCV